MLQQLYFSSLLFQLIINTLCLCLCAQSQLCKEMLLFGVEELNRQISVEHPALAAEQEQIPAAETSGSYISRFGPSQ